MKKTTLLTVFMIAISVGLLNAQTNKGNVMLGASSALSLMGTGSDIMTIGFTSYTTKSDAPGFEEGKADNSISINLLPKVGYFLIDNLALGLDFNMAFSSYQDGDNSDDKNTLTLFGAGPFVRYYFPTSSIKPFVELNSTFGSFNEKYNNGANEIENKASIMSLGAAAGIGIPLGEKVTFDISAGYTSFNIKDKEDNEDNIRSVYSMIGLEFGFIIFLGN